MITDTVSRFRVFCPYGECGHEYIKVGETKESIRLIIDRPCRKCQRLGVDAVELPS